MRACNSPHSLDQLPVGETGNQVGKSYESPQQRHHARLAKTQSGRMGTLAACMTAAAISGPAIVPYGDDSDAG